MVVPVDSYTIPAHNAKKGICRLKTTIMDEVYHIRIKKSYASDVIEDLRKMEAVELLEEPPIPDWQKEEVRRRLEELKKDTSKAIPWDQALQKIKQM